MPTSSAKNLTPWLTRPRAESDVEVRRELYAQAEDILNREQVGIIPIYWYTVVQLGKPEIERTFSVIGREAFEDWDISG